jgi:hypothetical protein
MNLEARQRHPASAMNAQILGEIRDFCRETRTAESTFGRRVVNDGKLVSRLRDGARITTETLEKVRSYLSVSRPTPSTQQEPTAAADLIGATSREPQSDVAPAAFRFFDNRQKYLLFVSTCSEKTEIANRVSLELANIHPAPPAIRMFDAGVGDGTVLSRVMRACTPAFQRCHSTSSPRRSATRTCASRSRKWRIACSNIRRPCSS